MLVTPLQRLPESRYPMSRKDEVLTPYIERLARGEVVNLTREQMHGIHRDLAKAAQEDAEPRPKGCMCHLEAGDSPCPVHGEGDE